MFRTIPLVMMATATMAWVGMPNQAHAQEATDSPEEVMLELVPAASSDVHGTAAIQSTAEGSEIVLGLEGGEEGQSLSAFLISGSCEEPGEERAMLATVAVDEGGVAHQVVELANSADEITATPTALQIRRDDEVGDVVACGDVERLR